MYLLTDEMMQKALEFISQWQVDSEIKPFLAKVYNLEETANAHLALESGEIIGNIIINCRNE